LSKVNSTKYFLPILAGIVLLFIDSGNAQLKNNLQIFNELVDSSINSAVTFIPDSVKNIQPDLESGLFSVFNSEIISELSKRGYNLVAGSNAFKLQYTFNNAVTSYGEMYRNGFLGEYYVPRKIMLSGSFNFSGSTIFTRDFYYSSLDTVNVDSVSALENSAYPFTQGKLPAEPFFSGILEPVVAVGTAALAVILFFTIRSK
jgi:hypothetical protein